ncbi:hypothetical protein CHH55_11365 [Niallia circulans]|jgi:hypothetical protein|uniref:Uncharacterized protein n=2 Tax=Niallia circulans TaxID=1397 RepID=A0A0J1IK71_NIACI|nr:hypothetical protein [Niallia circulans]KLV26338.1 hypothetical protein ABW02_11680 [Niallia circulans]MCM2982188.1 hypothetical protein [Niallia circulans]MDR4317496.1 hypothetical protein [Niallia circulans]MED3840593.1 hypothetical protein [Niallia circulans]MED4243597.1 hypothetical protein [Niallia circulans]
MQQQPTNMTQPNGMMMKPPVMVTVKDSLYLTDMLSWNLLAMKKAHFFAQNAQDPAIKSQLEKCGQMHQHHYERILSHLDTNSQPMVQQQQ